MIIKHLVNLGRKVRVGVQVSGGLRFMIENIGWSRDDLIQIDDLIYNVGALEIVRLHAIGVIK